MELILAKSWVIHFKIGNWQSAIGSRQEQQAVLLPSGQDAQSLQIVLLINRNSYIVFVNRQSKIIFGNRKSIAPLLSPKGDDPSHTAYIPKSKIFKTATKSLTQNN